MTPKTKRFPDIVLTPTLGQEAQEFFTTREDDTRVAYEEQINFLVEHWTAGGWHKARDLREDWRNAHLDWKRALAATPCSHRLAERSHMAQRCNWCWLLSTYSRLQKENDNDE